MNDILISIIIPLYNAEKYIGKAIQSVVDQTYTYWELIIIDDCSTDGSINVVNQYELDSIKLIALQENRGAAYARNEGIKAANGRFIAFLDADDFWDKYKLERQLEFSLHHEYAFTFTGYKYTDEQGVSIGSVNIPERITYKEALKNTTISTITVLIDLQHIKKELIYMPLTTTREDTATWWQILRSGIVAYGMNEPLSYYRRHSKSSSANKIRAVVGTWRMYRNCEKLTLVSSMYYFMFYIYNAIKRRVP